MSASRQPRHACPANTAPSRACSPGRPKDLSKAAAILEAAKRLFVEHGFDGVSMDQIAASAGVSKLTVYNHYGDKDKLFAEAARCFCEQGVPDSLFQDDPATPLRECLLHIATHFYAFISKPEAIAGHRMMCSPQMTASPVAALFWQSGPVRMQDGLAALLQRRADAGQLQLDDAHTAASQFFALLQGEPHSRLLFGCETGQCQTTVSVHLQASVDMLLRAYRPA